MGFLERYVQTEDMGAPGFRDFKLFNLALLARQVCCLLENPESLSARIMKVRYCPSGDLLHA
jgi:hypothetical protein